MDLPGQRPVQGLIPARAPASGHPPVPLCRCDRLNAMRICAPFAGIVRYTVADGEHVDTGHPVAVVETVKLEAPVIAPGPGVVRGRRFPDFADVTGGDVLLELEEN